MHKRIEHFLPPQIPRIPTALQKMLIFHLIRVCEYEEDIIAVNRYLPWKSVSAWVERGEYSQKLVITDRYRPPAQARGAERPSVDRLSFYEASNQIGLYLATPAMVLFEDREAIGVDQKDSITLWIFNWLAKMGVRESSGKDSSELSLTVFQPEGYQEVDQIFFPGIVRDKVEGSFSVVDEQTLKEMAYAAVLLRHYLLPLSESDEYLQRLLPQLEIGEHLVVQACPGNIYGRNNQDGHLFVFLREGENRFAVLATADKILEAILSFIGIDLARLQQLFIQRYSDLDEQEELPSYLLSRDNPILNLELLRKCDWTMVRQIVEESPGIFDFDWEYLLELIVGARVNFASLTDSFEPASSK